MRRHLALLLAALLTLSPASVVAQPAPPVSLAVRAELQLGALVVTWPRPTGQTFACVFATLPDRLLGCALGAQVAAWQLGPGSVDQGLRVSPGDLVEVRAYALTGEVVGIGEAPVLGRVRWLPIVVR